jgi:hypothetical protein
MLRSAAGKVMWVGRATVFMVGLAVILALLFGVATTALAGTGVGATFNLGKKNTVDRLSQLVGSTAGSMLLVDNNGAGTALDLRVGQGTDPSAKTVAPMKVDSQAKVTNLNADKLDNKDSTEIGVNGWEIVSAATSTDSNSEKIAFVSCPTGKIVVGSGYDILGGQSGDFPNRQTDVVVTSLSVQSDSVRLTAFEEEATSGDWTASVQAICAKPGTP